MSKTTEKEDQDIELIIPDVREKKSPTIIPETTGQITPMDLLQQAVNKGADLDKMEKLLDLRDRWEKTEAEKAYTMAMAAFKANAPEIVKDKNVSFVNNDNSVTSYNHATLAQVSTKIAKEMSNHGLSHAWETEQLDGGIIKVTCVITHSMGHSTRTSLQSLPDSSGKKNAIQQVASTVTYLERYTLLAATGLATKEQDDDGNGSAPVEVELINEDDAMAIAKAAKEKGIDPQKIAMAHIGPSCTDIRQLPKSKFATVMDQIKRKKVEK